MEHLRHLLPFVKRYRWQLLFGLICAACSAALTAAIPQLLRLAVDELHVHELGEQRDGDHAVPADVVEPAVEPGGSEGGLPPGHVQGDHRLTVPALYHACRLALGV